MSFYVCGDTHQDTDLWKLTTKHFDARHLSKNDYVLICGDCGILWDGASTDRYLKKWYGAKPWTTLFIDGNHENFDLLESYPVAQWNGGKVHRITDSVIHLMRGQVYTVDGRKFFTMGGASSHDKEYRIPGRSWWERELPSLDEYAEATSNLAENGNAVDYIFTHCASSRAQYFVDPHYHEDVLTHFLTKLEKTVDFKAWYFGHYHVDLELDERHQALFDRVIRLW